MSARELSGGCQCGAIRFRAGDFGRASLCHCRMCQKAFGGIGGALVTARDIVWTRGTPKRFASSDRVQRGFCADCGTPLTFETATSVDLAIAAFDDPAALPPVIQLDHAHRIAWFDTLHTLPVPAREEQALKDAHYATVRSRQHPDHDTTRWPETGEAR